MAMPQVHNPKVFSGVGHVTAGRLSLSSQLLESTLATRRRTISLNAHEITKLESQTSHIARDAKRENIRLERSMAIYKDKLKKLQMKSAEFSNADTNDEQTLNIH